MYTNIRDSMLSYFGERVISYRQLELGLGSNTKNKNETAKGLFNNILCLYYLTDPNGANQLKGMPLEPIALYKKEDNSKITRDSSPDQVVKPRKNPPQLSQD